MTIVEYGDHIAPGFDRGLGRQFQRSLEKLGLKFRLSTRVTKVATEGAALDLTLQKVGREETEALEADVVLVSIGRKPYTQGLDLGTVVSIPTKQVVSRSTPIFAPPVRAFTPLAM